MKLKFLPIPEYLVGGSTVFSSFFPVGSLHFEKLSKIKKNVGKCKSLSGALFIINFFLQG